MKKVKILLVLLVLIISSCKRTVSISNDGDIEKIKAEISKGYKIEIFSGKNLINTYYSEKEPKFYSYSDICHFIDKNNKLIKLTGTIIVTQQ